MKVVQPTAHSEKASRSLISPLRIAVVDEAVQIEPPRESQSLQPGPPMLSVDLCVTSLVHATDLR
jgi:hypothetical protein